MKTSKKKCHDWDLNPGYCGHNSVFITTIPSRLQSMFNVQPIMSRSFLYTSLFCTRRQYCSYNSGLYLKPLNSSGLAMRLLCSSTWINGLHGYSFIKLLYFSFISGVYLMPMSSGGFTIMLVLSITVHSKSG